jgi:hypothetical protein
MVAYGVRRQTSLHSSPMLKVNCPTVPAVGLTPPVTTLEPTTLSNFLICGTILKQAEDNIGTSEFFLVRYKKQRGKYMQNEENKGKDA